MTDSRAAPPGRSRRPQPKLLGVAALAVAAALGLAACGEKSEDLDGATQPFSLTLDSRPGPDHAGIYMARELGHFREAGLDVTIRTPSDPAPIEQVAAGHTDLAIAREPELVLAHEEGLDVVAVAAVLDTPLTSMIWLPRAGISGIGDLRGKAIATGGAPYQDAYLETILAGANLSPADVRTVNVGDDLVPALLGGRAQAALGSRNVEGVELRLRGKEAEVIPVDELGVPTYAELVLVARRDRVEADPKPLRLFIAALARGTAAAVDRPEASTETLLAADSALEPRLTRAAVKATLPLLAPDRPDRPYGYMSPASWSEFVGWMRDSGQISSLPDPAALLTDELLPGQIPQ